MHRAAIERTIEKVIEFGRGCGFEESHSMHVTRLGLEIFDQIKGEFNLYDYERFLLHCGSLLHDIGWSGGSKGHHKSSMRMILNEGGLDFNDDDRVKIALIARYHRKALPKKKHGHYGSLNKSDKYIVGILSGILRIADGLDRSHVGLVKSVNCEVMYDKMVIECVGAGVLSAEFAAAGKKSDLLSKMIERDIVLR